MAPKWSIDPRLMVHSIGNEIMLYDISSKKKSLHLIALGVKLQEVHFHLEIMPLKYQMTSQQVYGIGKICKNTTSRKQGVKKMKIFKCGTQKNFKFQINFAEYFGNIPKLSGDDIPLYSSILQKICENSLGNFVIQPNNKIMESSSDTRKICSVQAKPLIGQRVTFTVQWTTLGC